MTGVTSPTAQPAAVSPSGLHRLEHAAFRAIVAGFAALPRRLALRAGAVLGELLYHLDRRDRRVALFNLRLAFPDKPEAERRRILRESCRNLGRLAAEICHLSKLTRDDVARYIEIADPVAWERVFETAAQRGVVVVTGHFGNWELLAYVHGLLGRPITLVHRPMRNVLVDEVIESIRAGAGTRAIKKKAAAKEALRTLKQGGILVIPSDQNQTHSFGVFVDFFGKPACTTPGAARLAMMTGAAVIPVFLIRQGSSDRHRLEVLPEIDLVDTGERERDIVTNTQRCSLAIEEMIRRYPEQWIWFHKRWKTRPPGEAKLYS
jgi:KDO2-lipid IV(A) lauroyltransferase